MQKDISEFTSTGSHIILKTKEFAADIANLSYVQLLYTLSDFTPYIPEIYNLSIIGHVLSSRIKEASEKIARMGIGNTRAFFAMKKLQLPEVVSNMITNILKYPPCCSICKTCFIYYAGQLSGITIYDSFYALINFLAKEDGIRGLDLQYTLNEMLVGIPYGGLFVDCFICTNEKCSESDLMVDSNWNLSTIRLRPIKHIRNKLVQYGAYTGGTTAFSLILTKAPYIIFILVLIVFITLIYKMEFTLQIKVQKNDILTVNKDGQLVKIERQKKIIDIQKVYEHIHVVEKHIPFMRTNLTELPELLLTPRISTRVDVEAKLEQKTSRKDWEEVIIKTNNVQIKAMMFKLTSLHHQSLYNLILNLNSELSEISN